MSSQAGEITLAFDRADQFTTAASILEGPPPGRTKISVRTVSLADLMEEFQFSRVDFLKLDCEGSEYDILYQTDPAVLRKVGCIGMETPSRPPGGSEQNGRLRFSRLAGFFRQHATGQQHGLRLAAISLTEANPRPPRQPAHMPIPQGAKNPPPVSPARGIAERHHHQQQRRRAVHEQAQPQPQRQQRPRRDIGIFLK